ncbi:MAG: response regulator [Chloroflexi bacterium]|nr:MAG: response regulator [Chloroflexota bacterium]
MSWSILIVDDEAMTRKLLRMMLGPAGYEIFEAEDGLDALHQVAKQVPDLIILDIMMPNMDGLEVCRRLRAQKETADIPIIILSARTSSHYIEEGLRAGATRYLTKPITRQEILHHVREVLADVSVRTS